MPISSGFSRQSAGMLRSGFISLGLRPDESPHGIVRRSAPFGERAWSYALCHCQVSDIARTYCESLCTLPQERIL